MASISLSHILDSWTTMFCPQFSFQQNIWEIKFVALQATTIHNCIITLKPSKLSHGPEQSYHTCRPHNLCWKEYTPVGETRVKPLKSLQVPIASKDFRVVFGVVNFVRRWVVKIRQSNRASRWTHLYIRMQICFIDPGHCAQYRVRPHQTFTDNGSRVQDPDLLEWGIILLLEWYEMVIVLAYYSSDRILLGCS